MLAIASVAAVVQDGLPKPRLHSLGLLVVQDGLRKPRLHSLGLTVVQDGLRKPRLHSLGLQQLLLLQPLPPPQVMVLVARTGVIKITTTVFNVRDKFLN